MLALVSHLRHGPLRRLAPWRVAGRLYRRLQSQTGLPRSVAKRIGPYGPFRLNGRFAFSNFENWGEAHNAGFRACIELARGRQCMLDVGAHIGLVTLPASRAIAPSGRIHAFEPATVNAGFLKEHLALNKITNVVVTEVLVGGETNAATPFYEVDSDSGLNSAAPPRDTAGFARSMRAQVTVDEYCREQELKPELIKIDVEGAEVGVLRGATRTLALSRPTIVLSVHPRQIASMGSSTNALQALIDELGYEARTPDGGRPNGLVSGEYILSHRG